jgi:hypothetical protein
MKTLVIVSLTVAGILASGAFAQGTREYRGPITGPPQGLKLAPTKLTCSHGQPQAHFAIPQIQNQGPWVVKAGMKVEYTLNWADGSRPQVTKWFALPQDLPPGGWAAVPETYLEFYTCTARLIR